MNYKLDIQFPGQYYAPDSEGRLISEMDGTTGDTMRSKPLPWPSSPIFDSPDQKLWLRHTSSKVWLGLTPIAVIAANDNAPYDDARIVQLESQITAHQTRISDLETRNSELAARITTQQTAISTKQARITVLQGQIATHQAELDTLQAQCDAAGGGTPTLSYRHTDHLGKPQFATDATGVVVWDAGGQVTPFGDGINLAAAFAQNLQFPGQYYDAETETSHNHHRTYDPTLGRYLQSDPIGLAGGLNRYAYVGGNPMGAVDPMGLDFKKRGKIGRGDIIIQPGGSIDAWIADVIPGAGRRETGVICGCGNPPNNEDMDIDFFRHNGQWWKIKHGSVTIGPNGPPDLSWLRDGSGLGRVLPGMMYHPDKPARFWKWKDKDRAIEYIDNITDYSNDPNCINLPGLPILGQQKMRLRGLYKFH